MDNMLATVLITMALLLYTIGVWAERLAGQLKVWHLFFFWSGLVCDTIGTGLMFEYVGGLTTDVHGISGLIAIILMVVHASWASVVLWRKNEGLIANFHKFSVMVWAFWLIPYFTPAFGMMS